MIIPERTNTLGPALNSYLSANKIHLNENLAPKKPLSFHTCCNKLSIAASTTSIYEVNLGSFEQLVNSLTNKSDNLPIEIKMGLGASESSFSPRIYNALSHFCSLAEFVIRHRDNNLKCHIFIATTLGSTINNLDSEIVNLKALHHISFIKDYIKNFHPLVSSFIEVNTDNSKEFIMMLNNEVKNIANSISDSKILMRMSKGRSSVTNAKRYAASHAIQLNACSTANTKERPIILLPGSVSEKNFIGLISEAALLLQSNFSFHINKRIHFISKHCVIPPYYPVKNEPLLGDTLSVKSFGLAAWQCPKVRNDYLWLEQHPMKLFFIKHFNNYQEG